MLMPLRRSPVETYLPIWLCRVLAALIIVGAAVLRLVYLVWDCPLDLAPDEAHYWDWSRHLDWSYYSKGPLVAWLIRASCELFGPLSVRLSGTLMPAIRLPAVACGALLLTSLYVLTVQTLGRERLALAVVALLSTMPVIAAGSAIMTIDAPYTCAWGWALVLAHRAIFRGQGWAWLAAGLVVGVGILAKYNMVIFLPSVGAFLLFTPAYRPLLLRPGFWGMAVLAGLCCLPILVWNLQNDWVTFRHVHTLSGGAARQIHWLGPLIYLGGQVALLLVVWFFFWLWAMIAYNPLWEKDPSYLYLWWTSAPMFLLFLGFSPRTNGGEVNWAVTAYLSGGILAGAWIERQLHSANAWYRRWVVLNLVGVTAAGLLLTFFVHHAEVFYPWLSRLVGAPTPGHPCPLRSVDPTCRLRGWRTLGREIDALRQRLRAGGEEAVLACPSWSTPGELGVYCEGHPAAYSLGLALGDRHSQYDLWPGPVNAPAAFLGRTFIYLGGPCPELAAAFEHLETPRRIVHDEAGHPVAFWDVTVCRGFKGFSSLRPRGH